MVIQDLAEAAIAWNIKRDEVQFVEGVSINELKSRMLSCPGGVLRNTILNDQYRNTHKKKKPFTHRDMHT